MTDVICIVCPNSCRLKVDEKNDYKVTGNACERGVSYGRDELLNPIRVLTTTVRLTGSEECRCPVRTRAPIPRAKLMDAMSAIAAVSVAAPVTSGQVIIPDLLGTGVDLIATRTMN
ncbi:MAG: DUF1667 domain-containing protein [Ruminococcaceae bacterium]|nr:DUF1667 domain-containing protein [Oscillospiraceae bacterium]